MLGWAELKRRPAGAGGAPPDLLLLLRLSKTQLRSASLQEEVVNQVRALCVLCVLMVLKDADPQCGAAGGCLIAPSFFDAFIA